MNDIFEIYAYLNIDDKYKGEKLNYNIAPDTEYLMGRYYQLGDNHSNEIKNNANIQMMYLYNSIIQSIWILSDLQQI